MSQSIESQIKWVASMPTLVSKPSVISLFLHPFYLLTSSWLRLCTQFFELSDEKSGVNATLAPQELPSYPPRQDS